MRRKLVGLMLAGSASAHAQPRHAPRRETPARPPISARLGATTTPTRFVTTGTSYPEVGREERAVDAAVLPALLGAKVSPRGLHDRSVIERTPRWIDLPKAPDKPVRPRITILPGEFLDGRGLKLTIPI